MSKIYLIAICGLLLVCFCGTALAQEAKVSASVKRLLDAEMKVIFENKLAKGQIPKKVLELRKQGVEVCDGIDNDKDGQIDEEAWDAFTYYRDLDSDGYGDLSDTIEACSQPAGFVSDSSDCLDTRSDINPGKPEVPDDGLDNNCDGLAY